MELPRAGLWLKRKFAKLFQTDNQPAKLKYVHKNVACVTLVSEEEQEADLEKLREQEREKRRKEILGRLNKVKNAQEKALELKTRGAGAIVAWSCSNQDCQRLNRRNWQTFVEDGHTRYSNKYSHERQYCVEKYSVEQHRSDIVAAGGDSGGGRVRGDQQDPAGPGLRPAGGEGEGGRPARRQGLRPH